LSARGAGNRLDAQVKEAAPLGCTVHELTPFWNQHGSRVVRRHSGKTSRELTGRPMQRRNLSQW
jgi:hypothetical protein